MRVELEERFGQVNGAKLYQVQKEMCNVSQGVSDISTYFTKVKSLWDELDDLDKIPSCSCASAEKMVKREQNQKLLQFLMGLNDDYNAIRGNILMMSPLPSISQVYSMLIQERKQSEIRSTSHFLIEYASLAVESYKPPQFHKGIMDRGDSRLTIFMVELQEMRERSLVLSVVTARSLVIPLISVIDSMAFHQTLSSKEGEEQLHWFRQRIKKRVGLVLLYKTHKLQ